MQLFTPSNKVQKDRRVLRIVDRELAGFGRISLLALGAGVAAYLVFGTMRSGALGWTLLLTWLTAVAFGLQAYLLLRFDILYRRGAARWRNQYLWCNLFTGAALAAFVASVTWVVKVQTETWSVWLMSTVYVFAAVRVFAPYQSYCRVFLSTVLLPPLLSLLAIVSVETYIFAALYLILYGVSLSQCQALGNNFWHWQETNFLLQQKVDTAAAQTRGEESRLELNNEFIANMGQELKTALNDILGGVVLLQDSSLTERQRELIAIAEKASERQLQLIDNIVDFAKISKKKTGARQRRVFPAPRIGGFIRRFSGGGPPTKC